MAGPQRPTISSSRSSMRPPARPNVPHYASMTGRAASPAPSNASSNNSSAGVKRKERDFDHDHGEETNIHVVVRCRGRSEREVRENSGVVVSTTGVKGQNVELCMGPNAISNKTYYFDKVFSPAADQAIIYDDVVAPILNEMLTGFNCTIFAYGQTGTGKTYTMSGDMTDTYGLLSDAAGIIPRVLYSLFQKLESDEVECSVKCSFIELYNEELRDLLSPDETVKLKIYDDSSKKSHTATVVQGMEESYIQNAAAGIKLLQQGSYRRQVAATKCNDLSSRSHTVFTITTYMKKPSETGEDYICSGKLNLVDLAGSENIQRSGAENKRAAEAGLINKSLLTLGRVINALVDKGSHIPYRESKLTRLLQDSLGGRTKTCIIATVSPAKSNLEETISTLDYAFRAKNIRNKPQVNSMISKKTLLKEFTSEIEKLKSELIATRQRNGVYLSNEQYEEITVESESRRILSEEQRARIETLEVSLRNKVQELFSLTNNFTIMKRDTEATRATLESTKDILVQTEAVLAQTERDLAEEAVLRQAHELTEEQLFSIGTELVSTVDASLNDVDGLHAKLRRRSDLHHQNRVSWESSVGRVTDVSQLVDARIEQFRMAHAEMVDATTARLEEFLSAEKAHLEKSAGLVVARAAELGENHAEIESQCSGQKDAVNNVLEEIKDLRDDVKEKVGVGLQGLSQAAAKISAEVISELEQFHTQLHSSFSGLGKDFKALFEDMTKQLAAQREVADSLRFALQEANCANIEAQLAASTQLEIIRDEEKQAAAKEKERLKEQILQFIDSSYERQEERFSSRLINTQSHLLEATEQFENADKVYREGMDRWTAQDSHLMIKVVTTKDDLKTKMKGDWTAISTRNNAIQKSTKAVHEETVKIVDAQLTQMATQMAALDEFVTRARSQNESHHAERVNGLKKVVGHAQEGFADLGNQLATRTGELELLDSDLKFQTAELDGLSSSLHDGTRPLLRDLTEEISTAGLMDYVPTGHTPQKREWNYPTTLPRTENHDSIIARLRGLPDPALATKTPSTARTPGRSPRKQQQQQQQTSPRKPPASPSKQSSPSKTKVFTDIDPSATVAQQQLSSQSQYLPHMDFTVAGGSAEPMQTKSGSLKEIDINVAGKPAPAPASAAGTTTAIPDEKERPVLLDFSKSVGSGGVAGQPPLKRHATTNAVVESKLPMKLGRAKSAMPGVGMGMGVGVENFSQSVGVGGGGGRGGRRLRSSPPE
ncbi:kinesin family member 11 [Capronia coronata CBS 617.96]|uniref:Kinesin family member 11 n=1 Tax=Capronia coronata CBS 617.96 TaxID=1182541 RepID=W9Z459_9EURO|nr:kinesin family member 11 [Capronia coronata CBS 617.96]EXJ96351.1 kinesin family member 11 [Capronia coronata CBS 617.96]